MKLAGSLDLKDDAFEPLFSKYVWSAAKWVTDAKGKGVNLPVKPVTPEKIDKFV
jgi:hypothetical protein